MYVSSPHKSYTCQRCEDDDEDGEKLVYCSTASMKTTWFLPLNLRSNSWLSLFSSSRVQMKKTEVLHHFLLGHTRCNVRWTGPWFKSEAKHFHKKHIHSVSLNDAVLLSKMWKHQISICHRALCIKCKWTTIPIALKAALASTMSIDFGLDYGTAAKKKQKKKGWGGVCAWQQPIFFLHETRWPDAGTFCWWMDISWISGGFSSKVRRMSTIC